MTHFRSGPNFVAIAAIALALSGCGGTANETPAPAGPIQLAAASLGTVEFGEPPFAVFGELNSFLGEPDIDSGWIPPDSPLYGSCPGLAMRAAGWGSLYAFFVTDEDVTEDNVESVGRLYSYSYGYDFSRNEGATDPRNLALTTEDGIGLGSSRGDLETRYGTDVTIVYSESADTWVWSAADDGGELRGLLSGPENDDTVVLIESSPSCEIS